LNFPTPVSEMSTWAGPDVAPLILCLDDSDPATSRRPGSFNHDRETGLYPLIWGSLAEFDTWRQEEELANSIELIVACVEKGNKLWSLRRYYVCSREWSGGKPKYERKCPDRLSKDSKKTGCQCKITIKRYPHTPTILGRYERDHDHDIGLANIAYLRISHASREQIRIMLEKKIDPREIVRELS
jgi:hypothetical protein